LVNAYRRRKLEGAHVIVSHRLAENGLAVTMIHTGTSFPGTPYFGYPAFRLRLGDPLLLEDVLVKHPKLRLWIAHGGEPWTEETIALTAEYPQIMCPPSIGSAAQPDARHFTRS
jgi:predicted TIM-barrel fold metal-dependent hydrolase